MKTQTVLQAPSFEEMAKLGFKRLGTAPKRAIRDSVNSDLPYTGFFFCPVSSTKVELWFKK